MNQLLTLDQASARVASVTNDREFNADSLIDLVKQERLQICFSYRGDICMTWEHSPGGNSKEVGSIPFNGVVKLMQPPTTSQVINEFGVLVSILRADSQIQRTGQPYRLPMPTDHGGYIKTGYTVEGLIENIEIPRSQWMILAGDLQKIITSTAADLAHQQNTDAPPPLGYVEPTGDKPASETKVQRCARYLDWLNEEERIKVHGALQRVYEREKRQNPKADRSNIGKDIDAARGTVNLQKQAKVWPSQFVRDGKRHN